MMKEPFISARALEVSGLSLICRVVLSSQRRRDRINEKMRALQELIPNSNKVCSQSSFVT